jgi:cytochrome b pre-mRNA-processing protein 3
LSLLQRIFGETKERAPLLPLYRAIVARGRDPFWYREGQVPDTLDGRFDMIAALLALVLLRIEREGEAGREPNVLITEIFIEDMDATLRQIGVGDHVVGKQVANMMSALGGRLGAFRDGPIGDAVRRNIFHDSPPSSEAMILVADRLGAFTAALGETDFETLLGGALP